AFIAWEAQDFAASFAATEMTTQTTLRTTNESDDTRVLQAFEQARRSLRLNANLTTEPNPQQETRDSILTLVGPSKTQLLADRTAMVSAMQSAFQSDGGSELHDIGNAPSARPVQNHSYLVVKQWFRWGALVILLLGLTNLIRHWRPSELPHAALAAILVAALTLILTGLRYEGTWLWFLLLLVGPPAGLIALVSILTQRVHRARWWTEDRAKIINSRVEVEHHRFAGDTTKVRNL